MSQLEEDNIEDMIAECVSAADKNPEAFTEWEHEFIESIECLNFGSHLTEKQIEKLIELYDEKV